MYRTLRHISVMALLLTLVLLVGCHSPGTELANELGQGVVGTVWLRPGFDGEDAHNYYDPPDLTPRPLAGATVYLMKYSDVGPNSRNMVAMIQSDSLGRFEFRADPGTYHLACASPTAMAVVHRFTPGDTTGLDFPINVLLVVTIRSGEFTEQSFEIAESFPQ